MGKVTGDEFDGGHRGEGDRGKVNGGKRDDREVDDDCGKDPIQTANPEHNIF